MKCMITHKCHRGCRNAIGNRRRSTQVNSKCEMAETNVGTHNAMNKNNVVVSLTQK